MYGELPEKDEVSTLTFTLAINSPGNETKSQKSISNFCSSLKDGNKKKQSIRVVADRFQISCSQAAQLHSIKCWRALQVFTATLTLAIIHQSIRLRVSKIKQEKCLFSNEEQNK